MGTIIIGHCQVCGRRPGLLDAERNRFGGLDPNPETPLGELDTCLDCGRRVCPDCLHERECCECDAPEGEVREWDWQPPPSTGLPLFDATS